MARLISLVEEASPRLREAARLLAAVPPRPVPAHVVGITGPPGVGKSTITSALLTLLRARGVRVGVLAVDPSSPFSGGALLGDRVRMAEHALDEGVYIRSMAARGHLGGLAWSTPQALRVLEVAGCDVVLVETVGVGQSELEVAGLADTTVVVLAPGLGDGIQAAKAGVLEIGDVHVVNKADRGGAEQVRRDLRSAIALATRGEGAWEPPVLLATAAQDEGLTDVVAALEEHRAWLAASGEGARRRLRRAREEVEAIATGLLRERWAARTRVRGAAAAPDLDTLAAAVAAGRTDAWSAAGRLLGDEADLD